MLEPTLQDLIAECYKLGFDIRKDTQTDYFRYHARHWVEDSGLFDTPEEACYACIETHKD